MIDRSFEKCPYCNGSGLILNTNSISEQIMKVIKEKAITNKSVKINVKCNSALAETLINEKREEIHQLEQQYECTVNFNFYNHYSLHEPNIEIEKSSIKSKVEIKEKKETLTKSIKKTKKKVVAKKTTKKKEIKINSNKKQKNKKVQNEKEEDIINTNEEEIAKIELIKEENEKSGWWSE